MGFKMFTDNEIEDFKNCHHEWLEHKKQLDKIEQKQRMFERKVFKHLKPICDKFKVFSDTYWEYTITNHSVIIRVFNGAFKSLTLMIFLENLPKIKNYDDLIKNSAKI